MASSSSGSAWTLTPTISRSPGVELALEAVGRVGDLLLRVAHLDGRDHAAQPVDLVEVAPDLPLDLVGQRLDEPRAAERVDVLVTPVSSAMTCCWRRASSAASAEGTAHASS
jgi:hypothetical protein